MLPQRGGGDRALWRWEGKSLINKKTGLAMDLEGNRKEAGARVLGTDYHGLINQQWRLEGKHIRCEGNILVLDIMGNNISTGAWVKVWSKNHPDTPNQMWNFPEPQETKENVEMAGVKEDRETEESNTNSQALEKRRKPCSLM